MATIKSKFHELGNWHNKMSLAAIVVKESLTDKDAAKLSGQELKAFLDQAGKTLEKIEQFITGADKVIDEIKPFIYEKIGADADIPP